MNDNHSSTSLSVLMLPPPPQISLLPSLQVLPTLLGLIQMPPHSGSLPGCFPIWNLGSVSSLVLSSPAVLQYSFYQHLWVPWSNIAEWETSRPWNQDVGSYLHLTSGYPLASHKLLNSHWASISLYIKWGEQSLRNPLRIWLEHRFGFSGSNVLYF